MKAFQNLYRKLQKRPSLTSVPQSLNEVYQSIESMPVVVWFKIHDTGDLKLLLTKAVQHTEQQLLDAWNVLYNQYIDRFGLADTFLDILKKRAEIAGFQCQYVETGDRSLKLVISTEQQILLKMQAENSGRADYYKHKAVIEKTLGFQLRPETSVAEYYSYLSVLKEQANGSK